MFVSKEYESSDLSSKRFEDNRTRFTPSNQYSDHENVVAVSAPSRWKGTSMIVCIFITFVYGTRR
jgi:hypothetical protein